MITLNQKNQKIIKILLEKGKLQSSDVYREVHKRGEDVALVTVKRALSEMAKQGFLSVTGSGRATTYAVSNFGRLFAEVDTQQYIAVEPDKRYGLHQYNGDIFSVMPSDVFSDSELQSLQAATAEYQKRTKNIPTAIQKKELERLVIELSWKSSKIEGNTYTLLDTEKLIIENKKAVGHSQEEAQMILNHKDAFYYIRRYAAQFKTLTRKNLEELHAIIVKNLHVDAGLRARPVGITGSAYKPLDNPYHIAEAVGELSKTVSRLQNSYVKALVALAGVSYIQPFADGNKRTSRLMANALLLAHELAPLSYRSVDEDEYRSAMLVFYELNSIMLIKKIFIGQYEFAARNYTVA